MSMTSRRLRRIGGWRPPKRPIRAVAKPVFGLSTSSRGDQDAPRPWASNSGHFAMTKLASSNSANSCPGTSPLPGIYHHLRLRCAGPGSGTLAGQLGSVHHNLASGRSAQRADVTFQSRESMTHQVPSQAWRATGSQAATASDASADAAARRGARTDLRSRNSRAPCGQ